MERPPSENHEARIVWAKKKIEEICPNKSALMVEIGVWKADFGHGMLSQMPNLHWIGIDPFVIYDEKRRRMPNQNSWDAVFLRVQQKMRVFGERSELLRFSSQDAVDLVPDGIDFLFIDGWHVYTQVMLEQELYVPKVRVGGIVSGHDYWYDPVKRAAHAYAERAGKAVRSEWFEGTGVWWWQK